MSEYQYYEFRAIDRRLSEKEMAQLRTTSSRAEITPTKFVNEYHYGDFRGSPEKLMEQYYDAFAYVANWGTRRLTLRVPRTAVVAKDWKQFHNGDWLKVWSKGAHLLVDITSAEEGGGGWEEGEGWLEKLLPVRDLLLEGDLRPLYLGWLAGIHNAYGQDLKEHEPPVPAGMNKLKGSLKTLVDFLRLDDDLLARAAQASEGKVLVGSGKCLTTWIKALPSREKDRILAQLVEGENKNLAQELRHRFRQEQSKTAPTSTKTRRRTIQELLEAWEAEEE